MTQKKLIRHSTLSHSTLSTPHYKPLSGGEKICVYLLRRRRNLCVNPSFRMASVQICDLRENIKHPACSLASLAHKSLPQISQIFTDLSLCTCHVLHPKDSFNIPHATFNITPHCPDFWLKTCVGILREPERQTVLFAECYHPK